MIRRNRAEHGRRPASPVWLFDLDNTLHDAGHAILPQINAAMTDYVGRLLNLDALQAARVRTDYWQRYGATLLGLVRHHGVQADEFLAATHCFDDLAALIRAERGLARHLRRLPGRKVLLTNAPQRYSSEVLIHLRLKALFGHHVAIEGMHVHGRLRPKPDRLMLLRLLSRLRVRPTQAVLVEDTLGHLKRYRRLGIRTAWVTGYLKGPCGRAGGGHGLRLTRRPAYVDMKVKSVSELARRGSKRLHSASLRAAGGCLAVS